MKDLLWAAGAFLALVSPASGQSVRVQLHGETAAVQVSGLLVSLLSEHDSTVAQGLSDANGIRLLNANQPGTYRVLVRRIGYVPVRSDPIAVAQGAAPVDVSIKVPAERVLLPAVRVTAMRKECSDNDENALAAATVWDQIRTALLAAEASRRDSLVRTRVTTFERELSPTNVVTSASSKDLGVSGTRPFATPDPAFLSQRGYIVVDSADVTMYYAPDANVLLSKEFEQDHCFGLVAGSGDNAGSIGLAFHRVHDRRVAEIEGTLWLNKSTLELQTLTFQYVDYRFPAPVQRVGGEIEFQRIASGAWFPSYWMLRMPRFGQRTVQAYDSRVTVPLAGYVETGATATEAHQVDMRAFSWSLKPTTTARSNRDRAATNDTAPSKTPAPASEPSLCRRLIPGAITGVVRDESGAPIPFANISLDDQPAPVTITDRTGCFIVSTTPSSVRSIAVRRIGYRERRDSVRASSDSAAFLDVRLTTVPTALGSTEVIAKRERALELNGFYDRMLARKNGVGDAGFVTPEDIQRAQLTSTTAFLWRFPSIRLSQSNSDTGIRPWFPMGDGGRCLMNVYLDGMRFPYDPQVGIDQVVAPGVLLAIEVYPKASQAPAQYQSGNAGHIAKSSGEACGVILVWTKG